MGNGQTIHAERSRRVVGNGYNCGDGQKGERAHVLTSCGYVIEAHHVVESYGKACAIWREANAANDSEMKASVEDREDAWRHGPTCRG